MPSILYVKILIPVLFVAFFSACSQLGKELPDFEYESLEGEVYNNSSIESKVVIVNVWATWCGSCIAEIPDLNRLLEKYQDHEEVVFLAFSDEPYGVVKPLLDKYPFNYTQFTMAEKFTSAIQSRWVKTYPQNLIVDQGGKIVFEVSDASEDIYRALDQKIGELLTL